MRHLTAAVILAMAAAALGVALAQETQYRLKEDVTLTLPAGTIVPVEPVPTEEPPPDDGEPDTPDRDGDTIPDGEDECPDDPNNACNDTGQPPPEPVTDPGGPYPMLPGGHVPHFAAYPDKVTVQDGDLGDPETWNDGTLPGPSSVCRVYHDCTFGGGQTLTVYTLSVAPDAILTRTGENSTILVQNLVIEPGGTLDESQAGPGTLWRKRDLPLDTDRDPGEWGGGFLKLGTWHRDDDEEIVTPFLMTTEPLKAGQTTITLRGPPANWKDGGELVIGKSSATAFWKETERNRIKAIDGAKITLEQPLTYEHPAVYDRELKVVLTPFVSTLTRDVTYESENPDGNRGHHLWTGHAKVYVENVAFRGMGRTVIGADRQPVNIVGRYNGPHSHHHHDEQAPYIAGWSSDIGDVDAKVIRLRWNASIHQSHGGTYRDFVCAGNNADGAIVTEDGNEYANLVENGACYGGVAAYWWNGPRNKFRHLWAVGTRGEAHHVGAKHDDSRFDKMYGDSGRGHVKYPADPSKAHENLISRPYRDQAPIEYIGGGAIGCSSGLRNWEVGAVWVRETDRHPWVRNPAADPLVFRDMVFGNCRSANSVYYESYAEFHNCKAYCDPSKAGKNYSEEYPKGYQAETWGWVVGTRNTRYAVYVDCEATGFLDGFRMRTAGNHDGAILVRPKGYNVRSNYLDEFWQQSPDGMFATVIDPEFGAIEGRFSPIDFWFRPSKQGDQTMPRDNYLVRDGKSWQLFKTDKAPEGAVGLPGLTGGLAIELDPSLVPTVQILSGN